MRKGCQTNKKKLYTLGAGAIAIIAFYTRFIHAHVPNLISMDMDEYKFTGVGVVERNQTKPVAITVNNRKEIDLETQLREHDILTEKERLNEMVRKLQQEAEIRENELKRHEILDKELHKSPILNSSQPNTTTEQYREDIELLKAHNRKMQASIDEFNKKQQELELKQSKKEDEEKFQQQYEERLRAREYEEKQRRREYEEKQRRREEEERWNYQHQDDLRRRYSKRRDFVDTQHDNKDFILLMKKNNMQDAMDYL
jgi:hypothetical protein